MTIPTEDCIGLESNYFLEKQRTEIALPFKMLDPKRIFTYNELLNTWQYGEPAENISLHNTLPGFKSESSSGTIENASNKNTLNNQNSKIISTSANMANLSNFFKFILNHLQKLEHEYSSTMFVYFQSSEWKQIKERILAKGNFAQGLLTYRMNNNDFVEINGDATLSSIFTELESSASKKSKFVKCGQEEGHHKLEGEEGSEESEDRTSNEEDDNDVSSSSNNIKRKNRFLSKARQEKQLMKNSLKSKKDLKKLVDTMSVPWSFNNSIISSTLIFLFGVSLAVVFIILFGQLFDVVYEQARRFKYPIRVMEYLMESSTFIMQLINVNE